MKRSVKPRILLFVADPIRDWAGIVLTAYELCRRGAVCYVCPQKNGFSEVWALAPDFVLLPALRPYYARRAQMYQEAGIQFGLLDTEQSIYPSPAEYAATLWKDRPLLKQARCACMWGPAIRDYVAGNGMFDESQLFLTGCPRFDYYSAPLSEIYRTRQPEKGRPMVLINTNFTIGNYNDLSLPVMLENFQRNYGIESDTALGWFRTEQEAIQATGRMVERLAADFPAADFIIRPHPQERIETYQRLSGLLPNIRVTRTGAVTPWILRSAAIVQRGCTTAIEASLAGVPAFSPRWIPASIPYPAPESVSVACERYEDLRDGLRPALNGKWTPPAETRARIGEVISRWFLRMDGLAHVRVAETLLQKMNPRTAPDRQRCLRNLYGLHRVTPRRPASLASLVRYAARCSPTWSLRRWRDDTETGQVAGLEEFRTLLTAIHQIKGHEGAPPAAAPAAERGDYLAAAYRGRAWAMECV